MWAYTPDTGKLLFTDGDWRLFGWNDTAYIQHHCTKSHGGREWWYFAYDGTCGACHEETPVELIGLRNLHRWDR